MDEMIRLELGDRVAAALAPSSCDCRLGALCYLHAPEPADAAVVVWNRSPLLTVNGRPVAWYENWITEALQRSMDQRG